MIEDFLRNKGVGFEVIRHELAYTAQETAAAEHVSGHEFAKTVIVTDGDAFYMLVLPASHEADLEKVSRLVGAEVNLAGERDMEGLFPECDVGAEPPFGSIYKMATYVDRLLADREKIVFRGGSHEKTIKMAYDDYAEIENPKVASFAL